MDFRFSKTRIKKEMWQWLNGLDDSMVEKIRMPKAKAATLPWFQLKELAAYRLAKVAGMNFKNAQSFVADYKRKFPSKSPTDVLPSYKASGFCEAVKSAEDYIRKLFPKP
jgi:hypothetical protein